MRQKPTCPNCESTRNIYFEARDIMLCKDCLHEAPKSDYEEAALPRHHEELEDLPDVG